MVCLRRLFRNRLQRGRLLVGAGLRQLRLSHPRPRADTVFHPQGRLHRVRGQGYRFHGVDDSACLLGAVDRRLLGARRRCLAMGGRLVIENSDAPPTSPPSPRSPSARPHRTARGPATTPSPAHGPTPRPPPLRRPQIAKEIARAYGQQPQSMNVRMKCRKDVSALLNRVAEAKGKAHANPRRLD